MSPCPYCHAVDVCKPHCDRGEDNRPVCEACGEAGIELHAACQDHFDEDLCASCYDGKMEARWERQQEDLMSEPPMSAAEQHRRAWAQKQELRR